MEFKLEGEHIQLIQLLKATALVENGAMAQAVVSEGYVRCNGQPEYRKRYKVKRGDKIEFDGQIIQVL